MIEEIKTSHFMLANNKGFGVVIPDDCIFGLYEEKDLKDCLNVGTGRISIKRLGDIPVQEISPKFVDLLLAKEGITDRKAIVVEYNIEVDLFHLLGFESQLVKADFNTKLISTIGSGLAKMGVEMSICDDCKCVLRSIKTKKTLAVASNLEGALMFHDGMVAALDARLHRELPEWPKPIIEVSEEEEGDAKNDK